MEVLSDIKYAEWLIFAFCIAVITIGGSVAVNIILKKKIKGGGKYTQEKLDNINKWILRGIALFMIFIELYKHTRDLAGNGIKAGTISYGEFPFLLCSMPLWMFPFVAFGSKDNKVSNFLAPATFFIGIIGGTVTTILPLATLQPGEPWFANGWAEFSTTSCIHHALMIVFPVLMIYLGKYKPKGKDIYKAMIIFYALSAIALLLNYLIPGACYFMFGLNAGVPPLDWAKEHGVILFNTLMLLGYGLCMLVLFGYWIIRDIIKRYRKKTVNT